jgi:dihydroorotate dehydrogenase (fumarate)
MGIELSNPLIIGANNLVTKESNLVKMEQMGASAIVFKSLFEEQLHLENLDFGNTMDSYADIHPEITQPIFNLDFNTPKEYLYQLKKAKKALKKIPLFASLNAVYDESWVDYAIKIEKTGVNGIELNFYTVPKEMNSIGVDIIDFQLKTLQNIRQAVKLPIAVKLSPYYSNPLSVIRQMDSIGANGFVLFNRFFQPDIDLEKEEMFFPYNLSSENDYRLSMRFSGLLYQRIEGSICATNGIYTGYDVAKLLLVGADTVQIVSTLFKNGIGQIQTILQQLTQWMESKNYHSIDDFKGKLSSKNIKDEFAYTRAQYLDILLNSNEINKNLKVLGE